MGNLVPSIRNSNVGGGVSARLSINLEAPTRPLVATTGRSLGPLRATLDFEAELRKLMRCRGLGR